MGQHRLRVPRADAQRAVPPVPRRRVLTLANDQLGPERLVGGELGVNVAPVGRTSRPTTWFDNRMKNPVANVTIGVNTQQRQNLGRTRIWGFQTDVEYRLSRDWRVGAGYLFNQAKVKENAANPALVGMYLPQVPKHRGLGERRLRESAHRDRGG